VSPRTSFRSGRDDLAIFVKIVDHRSPIVRFLDAEAEGWVALVNHTHSVDWTPLPVPWAVQAVDRIPKQRYYDPEFYALENELFWPRVWQMACRLEELPKPGDFVEYEILTSRSSWRASTPITFAPTTTPAGTAA
jgi:hypothetical protein